MITGDIPFNGKTEEDIYEAIKLGKFTIPKSVPEDIADLISKLIVSKPEDRLGAQDIYQVKNHELFRDLDFDNLKYEKVPMGLKLTKEQTVCQKHLPKLRKNR